MACRTHQWTSYMGDQMAGGRVERGVEVWGWWGHDIGDELPGKGSSWLWGRVDWEKTPILMKARFVSNAEETAEKALKSSTITPEGQVIIITSTNIIPNYLLVMMIITFMLTIITILLHAGKHPHLWKVLLPVWGGGDQDGQGVGQQHHGGDQEHCWHDLGLGHGSILSRREWERRHRWESLGGYRASLIVRNLVRSSDRRTGDRYEDTLKYRYKYKYKYNPQIQ